VHLVEKDIKHIAGIRHIIKDMGFENIKPVHIDVNAYLKTCSVKYDVVFADPPYDLSWLKELPDLVMDSDIINENGFFILEHPRGLNFNNHRLFFEHRNYGGVNFSFFKYESSR
jgi:16S rRNA (guanine966-N2)-methyltransferase